MAVVSPPSQRAPRDARHARARILQNRKGKMGICQASYGKDRRIRVEVDCPAKEKAPASHATARGFEQL
jgi:hypothetical protein